MPLERTTRIFGWQGAPHPSYFNIGGDQKVAIGAAYAALIAILVLAIRQNNTRRKTPRQMQAESEAKAHGINIDEGEADYDPWHEKGTSDYYYQKRFHQGGSSSASGQDELYDDFFSFSADNNANAK